MPDPLDITNAAPTEELRQGKDDPYWRDLHPDGTSAGDLREAPSMRTAYDVKGANRRLNDFTDDELKQIPVLPEGIRLEQGATYIDLHAPEIEEFTARGDMESGPDNWYVPKSQVSYLDWNRLIGVDNPERLDREERP